MKLLFDQNLSRFLAAALADLFPGSMHVSHFNMLEAADTQIWDLAFNGGFVIVTKDQDFNDHAAVASQSPQISWIRLGNCPTVQIEHLIRWRFQQIDSFCKQDVDAVFVLP